MKTKKVTLEELKEGDKVIIINNSSNSVNEVGDIGIVSDLLDDGFRVLVEGRDKIGNWTEDYDVELIIK